MKLIIRHKGYFGLLFFLFVSLTTSFAQTPEITVQDSSLNELLELNAYTDPSELQKIINSKVSVSSKKELSVRETPGIISLITSEEILNSGARDMIDVLRLVPGLDFGTDVDFAIGLSVRGNWAYEGKVLFLVDGIMNNEILYQTVQLGNHFPIDLIERIEIIRGPGSTIYGGAAEYGVINIITKGGNGLNGIAVAGIYGQMEKTYGRRNVGLSIGKKVKDFRADFSLFRGQGNRTDQDFAVLPDVQISNLKDSSQVSTTNINMGLGYKNGNVRFIYDSYKTITNWYELNHSSFQADLNYKFSISKKFTITPQVTYTNQIPWNYNKSFTEEHAYEYKVDATRLKFNLTGSYDLTNKINLIVGSEGFLDKANDKLELKQLGDSVDRVEYNNIAIFAQGLLKHRLANITAGFRYDRHSEFGGAFVPRIGITKKIENFHFKVLYSNSFRSPSIQNMVNPEIKPERSNVMELETGYQFTPEMLLTINLFRIRTKDPIIYTYDPETQLNYYINNNRSGSSGIEAAYQARYKWGYVNLGYSFYLARKNSTVDNYRVDGKNNVFLGFPSHKLSVNSNIKLIGNLRLNTSMVFASERYGYTSSYFPPEEPGKELESVNVQGKVPPYFLMNVFLRYEDLFTKGLSAGVGVYDLLNQKTPFIQPYDGGYAPLPGPSREFIVKLSYNLSFSQ